MTAKYLE